MSEEENEQPDPREGPTGDQIAGGFPRPEGPDIELLEELIVNRLREETEGTDETDLPLILQGTISADTAIYVSLQRAMGSIGIESLAEFVSKQATIQQLSTLWLEGFLLGAWFQEHRDKDWMDAMGAHEPPGMDEGLDDDPDAV